MGNFHITRFYFPYLGLLLITVAAKLGESFRHGEYLDSDSYKQLTNIGIKQCAKRCYAEANCQSINFSKSRYICYFSYYNSQEKQLLSDSEYIYGDRNHMSQHFPSFVDCPDGHVLLRIHDGRDYCYQMSTLQPSNNGSGIVASNNGSEIVTSNNGSEIVAPTNESEIAACYNGSEIVACYNASEIVAPNNGSETVACFNGSEIVSCHNASEIVSPNNASVTVACFNGTEIVSCYNASEIEACFNGTKIVACNNASEIVAPNNGSETITCYNGTEIVACYNRSEIVSPNNGSESVTCYNGSRLMWQSNPDVTVSVSSTNSMCSLERASLDYNGEGSAWCASSKNSPDQFIQFEFNVIYEIYGVITQGRGDYPQWITSYGVSSSDDAVTWTPIGGDYTGNSDSNTWVTNSLPSVVKTSYLRILLLSFASFPSTRFDLVACRV